MKATAGRAEDLPLPSAGTSSPPMTRLSPLPFVLFDESQKATELGLASFLEARTVAFADSGAPRATDVAEASFVTFRPVAAKADAGSAARSAAHEAHAKTRRRGTIGEGTTPGRRIAVRELLGCSWSYWTVISPFMPAAACPATGQ